MLSFRLIQSGKAHDKTKTNIKTTITHLQIPFDSVCSFLFN